MSPTDDQRPAEMLMRRGTALLLEAFFLRMVILPAAVLVGQNYGFFVAPLAYGLAVLLRDALFGGTSPGKRIVGLRVVQTASDAPPRPLSAGLRNIPLFFWWLGWIVEAFAAGAHDQKRRLGDRIGDTEVVDATPSLRRLPWALIFFVTAFGSEALLYRIEPSIYAWIRGLQ